jgi:hypothetical protein
MKYYPDRLIEHRPTFQVPREWDQDKNEGNEGERRINMVRSRPCTTL